MECRQCNADLGKPFAAQACTGRVLYIYRCPKCGRTVRVRQNYN